MKPPLRLAVLLSGSGRTLANLLESIEAGRLHARVVAVASDRDGVRGIQVAQEAGLPVRVFPRAAHADRRTRDAAMLHWLDSRRPQVLVLAGYLSLLDLRATGGRPVLNIHPALLPRFGGKGYYGDRVHAAVLEAGEKESGATVHLVDERYDEGSLLAQARVPVREDDDLRSLADRVFAAERRLYPEVLEWMAQGRLRVVDGRALGPEGPWEMVVLRGEG